MRRFALALLLLLTLVACSSDDSESSAGPGTKKLVFLPTPTASGPSVSLRQKELTDTHLVLELVGHSLPDVYGVAFRLSYDTTFLAFEKQEPGTVLSAPVSLSSEKTPGLVAGVVSKKGAVLGVDGSEKALVTVSFKLLQKQPTAIELVLNRNSVIDSKGVPATTSFTGGALGFE